jgi:formylglycine-generating enzyme required for sulfatase activity
MNPEELIKRYAPNQLELIEQYNCLIKDEPEEMQWYAYSLLVEQILPSYEFDVITVDATGEEINRQRGKAHYFTEDLGNGVGLEMVYIPGGEAVIGEEPEKIDETDPANWSQEKAAEPSTKPCIYPLEQVKIKPFFLGKYPITNFQWNRIATEPVINQELELRTYREDIGGNFPLTFVYNHEPNEFCERLSKKVGISYRLPNDAEWEYACRAGTITPYHFGEVLTPKLANYRDSETFDREKKKKQLLLVSIFRMLLGYTICTAMFLNFAFLMS